MYCLSHLEASNASGECGSGCGTTSKQLQIYHFFFLSLQFSLSLSRSLIHSFFLSLSFAFIPLSIYEQHSLSYNIGPSTLIIFFYYYIISRDDQYKRQEFTQHEISYYQTVYEKYAFSKGLCIWLYSKNLSIFSCYRAKVENNQK